MRCWPNCAAALGRTLFLVLAHSARQMVDGTMWSVVIVCSHCCEKSWLSTMTRVHILKTHVFEVVLEAQLNVLSHC